MMQGVDFLALSNISRNLLSDSPTYLSIISGPFTSMNDALHSAANVFMI